VLCPAQQQHDSNHDLPRASLGDASLNLLFLTVRKHFLIFSLNFPFLKFILFTPILRQTSPWTTSPAPPQSQTFFGLFILNAFVSPLLLQLQFKLGTPITTSESFSALLVTAL